ncbi:plasmid mobilization protein [Sphingobacterium lactis]|uniref:plasmid mobilization protein n=1 Tax=Sphingobacterium TaxID=28453 RepID=UPI0021A29663|nr:plasmid mobilization relaxosome protein MobC [Sphingobacterium hotanense]MCT1525846.1 plasmid mobilization relaxosome protein MobC [Sphingobacterium hotanense]
MTSRKKTSTGDSPPTKMGGKSKIVQARVTEDEFRSLHKQATDIGLTMTTLIRNKLLGGQKLQVVNSKELLQQLDHIGAEIGRTGNNINQLARHANALIKHQKSPISTLEDFIPLFQNYIQHQNKLEKRLRQLLRMMAK